MEHRARITSGGRVTVPKAVRRALGVRSGDSLVFEVTESGVRARGWRTPTGFADYAGAWREDEGMSLQEINAYIRGLRGHDDGRGD